MVFEAIATPARRAILDELVAGCEKFIFTTFFTDRSKKRPTVPNPA